MRVAYLFLIAVVLIMVAGCSWFENDDNVVNSIPKTHKAYPVFHLLIDNGYQEFGVDSVLLTAEPEIGWMEAVYSDSNGFIGTLPSGTYITSIDTTVISADSTVIDTTSVAYGFEPTGSYTFRFDRTDTFTWVDSFKIDYAMDIDSTFRRFSAETLFVSTFPDLTKEPVFVYDSIAIVNPKDTLNPPDAIYLQELLLGRWFTQYHVITNPDDTIGTGVVDIGYDTLTWGYWGAPDSFFTQVDSAGLCEKAKDTLYDTTSTNPLSVDTTINDFFVIVETISTHPIYTYSTVDTVVIYINCQEAIDSTQLREYETFGFREHDTTLYSTYPDTTKELIFSDGAITVNNTTSGVSKPATMYLRNEYTGTTTLLDSLILQLDMPRTEVFPHYQIIIKDE